MPNLIDQETGEKIPMSAEEFNRKIASGEIRILDVQQVGKNADGTEHRSGLLGFAEGPDGRMPQIFLSSDLLAEYGGPGFVSDTRALMEGQEPNWIAQEASEPDYGMMVDMLEKPVFFLFEKRGEVFSLRIYVRDLLKQMDTADVSREWKLSDGIVFSTDALKQDENLMYFASIVELHRQLKREGFLEELKKQENSNAGILVVKRNEAVTTTIVRGKDRPDLPCMIPHFSTFGGYLSDDPVPGRPYGDEPFIRESAENMSTDQKAEAATGGDEAAAKSPEECKKTPEQIKQAASDQSEARSEWDLACRYLNNPEETVDKKEAYLFAYRSAAQGYEPAISGLASLHALPTQLEKEATDSVWEINYIYSVSGTGTPERTEQCEKLREGDTLEIRESRAEPGRQELFRNGKSVGMISRTGGPINAGRALRELGWANLEAVVVTCVPKSKRGPRARSAELKINLRTILMRDQIPQALLLQEEAVPRMPEESPLVRMLRERQEAEERIAQAQAASPEQTRAESPAQTQAASSAQSQDASRSAAEHAPVEQLTEQERAEERAAYEAAYAKWREECREILSRRRQRAEEEEKEERDRLEEKARRSQEGRIEELNAAIEENLASCEEAAARLSALGIFKFSERRSIQTELKVLKRTIEDLKEKREQSKRDLEEGMRQASATARGHREHYQNAAEAELPLPPSPKKPEWLMRQDIEQSQKLKEEKSKEIWELLADGPATAREIGEKLGISNQEASAIMNRMEGVTKFTGEKRQTYFERSTQTKDNSWRYRPQYTTHQTTIPESNTQTEDVTLDFSRLLRDLRNYSGTAAAAGIPAASADLVNLTERDAQKVLETATRLGFNLRDYII